MSEQLYRRCRHVTPNGRQYWKSRPGIPHPINGSMSTMCYGYAPVDGVLMTEAEWWAKLPDGDLYTECEHLRNEDLCDVMCDAYVRGDGMVKVERGTDECQNPLGCRCVVADGRWISALDDATCDWCHSRERGNP
ncbi:hypothetical protein LCGC14_1052800 [marine sediment metagenome]|uniref:Uncharacterized protein n=1 Tax=marine sediment metagenome TaxID=412755 RepID=A0A0F9Q6H2_9ZZZZ